MTKKEVTNLKNGDFVEHSRYGLCFFDENLYSGAFWFGAKLRPVTETGINTLAHDSKTFINRLLEDSLRRLKHKVHSPKIPQIVIMNESEDGVKYELHEWNEAGLISEDGVYSTNKIKDFLSRDEALIFKQKQRDGEH